VDERQIMDIAYRRGSATAAEILRELSEPPSYSAGRALLDSSQGRLSRVELDELAALIQAARERDR